MRPIVLALPYLGPEASGNVGYGPRWHHLLGWETLLPGILLANATLQVGDLVSTWWALSHGAVEANPLSRALMAEWGFTGWMWAKLALASLFAAHVPLLRHLRAHQRAWLAPTAAAFGAIMLATVASNVAQTLVAA